MFDIYQSRVCYSIKKKKKFKISMVNIYHWKGCYYTVSLQNKKSQKVLVCVVIFLIYFAVLSLIYELKQSLEAQLYHEKNS